MAGALHALNIDIICANSSPAKGRVERANKTLQDRLVKELRLAGAAILAEGNALLPAFIADYNARFATAPANNKGSFVASPSVAVIVHRGAVISTTPGSLRLAELVYEPSGPSPLGRQPVRLRAARSIGRRSGAALRRGSAPAHRPTAATEG